MLSTEELNRLLKATSEDKQVNPFYMENLHRAFAEKGIIFNMDDISFIQNTDGILDCDFRIEDKVDNIHILCEYKLDVNFAKSRERAKVILQACIYITEIMEIHGFIPDILIIGSKVNCMVISTKLLYNRFIKDKKLIKFDKDGKPISGSMAPNSPLLAPILTMITECVELDSLKIINADLDMFDKITDEVVGIRQRVYAMGDLYAKKDKALKEKLDVINQKLAIQREAEQQVVLARQDYEKTALEIDEEIEFQELNLDANAVKRRKDRLKHLSSMVRHFIWNNTFRSYSNENEYIKDISEKSGIPERLIKALRDGKAYDAETVLYFIQIGLIDYAGLNSQIVEGSFLCPERKTMV